MEFQVGDRVRPDGEYEMCSKSDIGTISALRTWQDNGQDVHGYSVVFDELTGYAQQQLMFFESPYERFDILCTADNLVKV